MKESSVWISGRRGFQIEGTASAKALIQKHACPTCGTARRFLCEEVQVGRSLRALQTLVEDFVYSEYDGESV